MKREQLLLYGITDRAWVGKYSLAEQVRQALEGGVTILQLREKDLGEEELIQSAREIKEICREYQVPLIINDNLEAALQSGADGVHVGLTDLPVSEIRKRVGKDFIIGATAKTVEQARRAQEEGADYLGVGAVFPSPTKQNALRITREQLEEITASVSIPCVAIGGITLENLPQLTGTGIAGAAVVSAIFGASDIREASRTLKETVRNLTEEVTVEKKSQQKFTGKKMPTALSIAGSDSSGGAGIQADLKTMTMNGVFGMTAVTALTAQNTTGVTGVLEVSPEFLEQQMEAVFTDIRPDAVKIGMVSSSPLIRVIASRLRQYKAEHIVVDPVMVATSGSRLMAEEAVDTLKAELLPLAQVATPNIPEAEILSGMTIQSREDMVRAAKEISSRYGCSVLLKGGHSVSDADDYLYADGHGTWFEGRRIDNPNTHGTGCTLSSAIAAGLAKGQDLNTAVRNAKEYISGALAARLDLGRGSGPLNHAYRITEEKED